MEQTGKGEQQGKPADRPGRRIYSVKEQNSANKGATIRTRIDMIFRKLPFFMPWVWEMFVLIAILGFAFGMGLGTWADRSLMK